MSLEGQVDLDALIEKDKKEEKIRKTKQIEKKRQQKRDQSRRRDKYKHHRDDHRRNREQNYKDQQTKKREKSKQKVDHGHFYAVKIAGLLSDVSVDDICKLLGDRKIISIKTILKNKDLTPINSRNVSLMQAIVVLSDKSQATSFIKSYSEKRLDGKYQLTFSFVDPNHQLQ